MASSSVPAQPVYTDGVVRWFSVAAVDTGIKQTGTRCRVPVLHVSGGGGGIRTPDLYSAIVALSQLSYAPTRC